MQQNHENVLTDCFPHFMQRCEISNEYVNETIKKIIAFSINVNVKNMICTNVWRKCTV